MSNPRLHLSEPRSARFHLPLQPLGRYLIASGAITPEDLIHALDLQQRVDAPLGEVLLAEGLVAQDDLLIALSEQHHAQIVDLDRDPPQPGLNRRLPAHLCLRYQALPWLDLGGALMVATAQPHRFDELRRALGQREAALLPVIADERQIMTQISHMHGPQLASRAATRVPSVFSCRSWDFEGRRRTGWALAGLAALVLALILAPLWTITAACLLAFATLLMTSLLKAAALANHLLRPPPGGAEVPNPVLPFRLPKVSVLVPLLHEEEITGALIERLGRLTYPKSLLEVMLVLEAGDEVTKATIAKSDLPPWAHVIEVPEANRLTTKPRALNYALDFCRGSIIGVWDAEDAPAADQIEQVVQRFHSAPERVACLQGMLDYYNPRANWLARCFTIEYATWWRLLLPAVARLGLVVPLGGTTLFFRRDVLERLGGWDAHNVTEDADLGLRLARQGYCTELLPTVTQEEANCRALPWIRQRSRWLKGFLITWAVHMRRPRQLARELGFWRFWGVQTMLFATFCQFLLLPLLWSFWLATVGLPHPLAQTLGGGTLWAMTAVFILAETLNLCMGLIATSGPDHRHLMRWVLTMPAYFALLAPAAAAKALYEFVASPFFWDKTAHGITPPSFDEDRARLLAQDPAPPRPQARSLAGTQSPSPLFGLISRGESLASPRTGQSPS